MIKIFKDIQEYEQAQKILNVNANFIILNGSNNVRIKHNSIFQYLGSDGFYYDTWKECPFGHLGEHNESICCQENTCKE